MSTSPTGSREKSLMESRVLQQKRAFGCRFRQQIAADHTEEALEPLAPVIRQEIAAGRREYFVEFQACPAEFRFIFIGREADASEEVLSGQREIRRQENSQRRVVNLPNGGEIEETPRGIGVGGVERHVSSILHQFEGVV